MLVTVTLALGIAAPEESLITPALERPVSYADDKETPVNAIRMAADRLRDMIKPLIGRPRTCITPSW